jgi:hypothetical protein
MRTRRTALGDFRLVLAAVAASVAPRPNDRHQSATGHAPAVFGKGSDLALNGSAAALLMGRFH